MKINIQIKKLWYLASYRFIRPKMIITKASLSGDGIFIDIRYWLSRPDQMKQKITPYIITSQNQKIELMHLAKFGVVKSKLRKHTNTGMLLFYNRNKSVSSGERVTLYWDGLNSEEIIS